ncbi:YqhG family protein [Terribacillus sp. 179-K 1B1 HS]|uniref:YqhG family protein n=1 Tax=Terribacillus sp. 179-K 1B1 HS TaxID=3142388 RepID=UPI00399FD69D
MDKETLHQFLRKFFVSNGCQLLEENDGLLRFLLTPELDEELMNRPFYWRYKKRLGQEGEPMELTLLTDPNQTAEKAEHIHFGSPRLHKIFRLIRESAQVTRLYEKVDSASRTPLYPWLIRNMSVHFSGKRKRTETHSVGLQLLNGQLATDWMENFSQVEFKQQISDQCYCLSPIIRYQSGYQRISSYMQSYLHTIDDDWVKETADTLKQEEALLAHFFDQSNQEDLEEEVREERTALYQNELDALHKRLIPSIRMETINAGIFYLSEGTSRKLLHKKEA